MTHRFDEQGFDDSAPSSSPARSAEPYRRVESSRDSVYDDPRDLGRIVGDLTKNFSELMRQEVALAKAEVQTSAKHAGKGAGLLGGAGVAGLLAAVFASLALWWVLGVAIGTADRPSLGWSGLIVAVLWGIVAAILAASGKSQLKQVEGLPQTTTTVSKIPQALKGDEEENR